MNDARFVSLREMEDESLNAALAHAQDTIKRLMAEQQRREEVARSLRAANILATGLHDALDVALREALPRVTPLDWHGWPGTHVICARMAASLYDMGYRKE